MDSVLFAEILSYVEGLEKQAVAGRRILHILSGPLSAEIASDNHLDGVDDDVPVVFRQGEAPWTKREFFEVVRLLDRMVTPTRPYEAAWTFLKLCMQRPGVLFSIDELQAASGVERKIQVQSDLGVFSKCVMRVRKNKVWPMDNRAVGGLMHYRCSESLAAWIRLALIEVGRLKA